MSEILRALPDAGSPMDTPLDRTKIETLLNSLSQALQLAKATRADLHATAARLSAVATFQDTSSQDTSAQDT